uniref:hypothetical protein n=1 Tax=Xanthomonas albilineans TaxID=29447 RepID=UPI0027DC3B3F|nr:hypothetical protein [Xanthomonas albilineans]
MDTSTSTIDPARLAIVQQIDLDKGSHENISEGMCVMEAVSFVAGERWSDTPDCACKVIGTFLRTWNDSLPDNEHRTALLRDLVPRLVGTRSTPLIERRRAAMAADWLIRTNTSAWLRLAGLVPQADLLNALPEIMHCDQCDLMHALTTVRKDAATLAAWLSTRLPATWNEALEATFYAACDANSAAACDAVCEAVWEAVRDMALEAVAAAHDTARHAALVAARHGATTAWNAARHASDASDASDAASDALKSTKAELQQSAKALVIRMCECTVEG